MRRVISLLGTLVLASCSPAPLDPPMTRSCRGEYVDACSPYTWSHITNATLTPNAITLNDPRMMAHVHVDFASCAMAPTGVTVQIAAFVGATGDAHAGDGGAGGPTMVQLGSVGPAARGATSIDTMIANPFFVSGLPPDTAITLQFAPLVSDCEGDLFTIPYHTGFVVGP